LVFGGTHAGIVRSHNQDRFECAALSDVLSFGILCDGIGGENGGEVAAEMAACFAASTLSRSLNEELGETSIRSILQSAFVGANALVIEAAGENEDLAGMGTTMIAAARSGSNLYLANLGDSRAYLLSPEKETLLSHDHTLVQMMVDSGELSSQEAKNHPERHYVTRAIGASFTLDVDFSVHPIASGDIILLCSDGLYNYLEIGKIYPLVRAAIDAGNVDNLIEHAISGGGADNITAVCMKI